MELIFKRRFARLEYDSEKNRLCVVWEGFAATEEFNDVVDLLAEWVRKKNIQTIWSDSSKQEVISQKSLKYYIAKTNEMGNHGLRFYGIVRPKDDFSFLVFKSYLAALEDSKVKIGHFETECEMEKWLEQEGCSEKQPEAKE
ncbi:MAG: hypothetical protein MI784_12650 [Cytophagales bacterium]|nr:hypothetical protein [Cytophagales bacterium]